jgi:hypothetical protein
MNHSKTSKRKKKTNHTITPKQDQPNHGIDAWKLALQSLHFALPGIKTSIRYNELNQIDAIMWISQEQQLNYRKYNDCVQIDDTYKVCNEDAILFEGCVRTSDGLLASAF